MLAFGKFPNSPKINSEAHPSPKDATYLARGPLACPEGLSEAKESNG